MNNFAHPAKYHAVEAVQRMAHVTRWHMVSTTRQQTLAEHSCNVGMLAMLCARRAPGMFFGDPMHVSAAALVHDVGEVFTGDIPTPTKRLNPEFQDMIDSLELAYTPIEFQVMVSKGLQWLIKVCDLADGIRFIREHGTGDIAKHARTGLETQLSQYHADATTVWGVPPTVVDVVTHLVRFYMYGMS